jgi:tetratricopeptide (TPR) repeat protein
MPQPAPRAFPARRRSPARIAVTAALLATAALLGWGLVWLSLDRSVVTRVPVLDEAYYLREGAAIMGGQLVPDEPFVMSPLYPYLVAATGSGRTFDERGVRLGSPPYGIRIAQALAWLAIAWLLHHVARRLVPQPRWAAWLAPALFLLYQPAAVFVTTVLLEIPLTLAVLAALSLLPAPSADANSRDHSSAGRPRPSWRRLVGTGALIGTASLLRPIALVLLASVWLACREAAPVVAAAPQGAPGPRRSAGRAGRANRFFAWVGVPEAGRGLAVATLAALVVLLPVVLHNSVRAGRLVGVSVNGGMNFCIGQGMGANGFFRNFAGLNFDADPAGVAYLSARTGQPLAGPAEADRVWFAEAFAWVRDHPGPSLLLWLKKVWLHFAAWEIDQVTPLGAWQRDAPFLRVLFIPYGVIAGAGLAGLLLLGPARPWRPWGVAVLLIVAAQSLFFVVSRYRLVLVPLLCLFAAGWAGELARRRGRARQLAVGAALAAALAVWPWGIGPIRATWRATGTANEATRWERLGGTAEMGRAEELWRTAVVADPTQVQAWQGLARVLLKTGRVAEAERTLADGALRAEPAHLLMKDMIALLMKEERYAEALPRLSQYLRERPDDPDMLHAWSLALAQTGQTDSALDAARRLIAAKPSDPRGYVDLGVLLGRTGRRAEARIVFSQGLQRCPDSAALRHNLGLVSGEEAAAPPTDPAATGVLR